MSNRYLDLARQVMRDDAGTDSTPPRLPGRAAERPCLACGRECRDGELFHDETCFESWKARRRRSTSPQAARAATCPAPSIPLETTGPRGAA